MPASFKQFCDSLVESLTIDRNDVTKLVATPEFKKFEQEDKNFADKLKKAWEGDAKAYEKDPKKFDPIFSKMLQQDVLRKFSPNSEHLTREAAKLSDMQRHSFPAHHSTIARAKDTDVWGHERPSRA